MVADTSYNYGLAFKGRQLCPAWFVVNRRFRPNDKLKAQLL